MLLFLELFLRDEIFGRYLLSLGIFIHNEVTGLPFSQFERLFKKLFKNLFKALMKDLTVSENVLHTYQ